MSLRAFDLRDCPEHGLNSLHRYSQCVSCAREGRPAPAQPALTEQIPKWMRTAIQRFGDNDPKPKPRSRHGSGLRGHTDDLSPMERDVFIRLGWGTQPCHIAAQLGVEQKAIANAITRLIDKHKVGSRQQLRAIAKAAARAGE